MAMRTINPVNGELVQEFPLFQPSQIDDTLGLVSKAQADWRRVSIEKRADHLRDLAHALRQNQQSLASTITLEMGKLRKEALAEVEKCAVTCEYYANHGPTFLADEIIPSDAGRSLVAHQPLGTVLAVMPWNFPVWQVMRFAIPALLAGNGAVLKHASNVPQCALAMEEVIREAGLPENIFRSLLISAAQTGDVIADERVRAVTLTGSCDAGRKVASLAGQHLKKTVLELGGSDPFIVLADADLDLATEVAVASRFMNCGQSCIAAKRFIVEETIYDAFLERFQAAVAALNWGDPNAEDTRLAPMARHDLRDELHEQVGRSVAEGAKILLGGEPVDDAGAFYQATILTDIPAGSTAYREELFGPVASVFRVKDAAAAVSLANDTCFGLGGSIWTGDSERGEALAREVETGAVFVNGLVKSDARLPFGGVRDSGYGRELSHHGLKEFVNAKTIWVR